MVDRMTDSSSYSVKAYERKCVTDDEKKKSYLTACDKIGVSPEASKEKIKKETFS